MQLCKECGAEFPDSAKFCTNCGAEIVKKIVNAGRLINGIMEFTSLASYNPGEMIISNFRSTVRF